MKNYFFGSVIYLNAVPFVDEFLRSLSSQTFKEFTLLLISDGVDESTIFRLINNYNIQYEIISYQNNFTPAELRINLLREAKVRGAEYIILGDIDDTFSTNRVEDSITALKFNNQLGFVYNKFLLMNSKSAMPKLNSETKNAEYILEYNYLGLSNTAINMGYMTDNFIESLVECKSHVFDWYLFTRLLLNGIEGELIPNAITYYRLYGDNYVGIPTMTRNMIDKEIYVKTEHYKLLSKYDDNYKILFNAYKNKEYDINNGKEKYFWWNLTKMKNENKIKSGCIHN